jgi:hypothetical protein
VQRLPAALELVVVSVSPEILPNIFDGHRHRSLEQRVGEPGTTVGKSIAFPLLCVKEHLVVRHLYLAECSREGN